MLHLPITLPLPLIPDLNPLPEQSSPSPPPLQAPQTLHPANSQCTVYQHGVIGAAVQEKPAAAAATAVTAEVHASEQVSPALPGPSSPSLVGPSA